MASLDSHSIRTDSTLQTNNRGMKGKDHLYRMAYQHHLLEAKRSAHMLAKHTTLEEVLIQLLVDKHLLAEYMQLLGEDMEPTLSKTSNRHINTHHMA